jgi:hypothetical protein
MRKFKLIKTYPGFNKLGLIIEINSEQEKGYYSENKEFWEEVIEKDYEILSFISISPSTNFQVSKRQSNGKHKWDSDINSVSEQELLSNENYIIHSVKRLLDNEIFTIRDKIMITENITRIKTIKLHHNNLYIYDNANQSSNLKHITKVNFLFKTKDGFKIKKNDKYYALYSNFNYLHQIAINNYEYDNAHLRFAKENNLKEYILTNKICLSINDIKSCINETSIDIDNEHELNYQLIELVKKKINGNK